MKKPVKPGQKSPSTIGEKMASLSGSEFVSVVGEVAGVAKSHNQLQQAREQTRQVEADAVARMKLSDDEVKKAQIDLDKHLADLQVEVLRVQNARQDADNDHEQKMTELDSRIQLIAAVRGRIERGEASEEDYRLLQLLHSNH